MGSWASELGTFLLGLFAANWVGVIYWTFLTAVERVKTSSSSFLPFYYDFWSFGLETASWSYTFLRLNLFFFVSSSSMNLSYISSLSQIVCFKAWLWSKNFSRKFLADRKRYLHSSDETCMEYWRLAHFITISSMPRASPSCKIVSTICFALLRLNSFTTFYRGFTSDEVFRASNLFWLSLLQVYCPFSSPYIFQVSLMRLTWPSIMQNTPLTASPCRYRN